MIPASRTAKFDLLYSSALAQNLPLPPVRTIPTFTRSFAANGSEMRPSLSARNTGLVTSQVFRIMKERKRGISKCHPPNCS
jgi:hypothetical protein